MCSSFSLKGDCAASLALAVAPTTPPRLLQSAEGTSSGPRLECLFSFLPLFNQLCLCFRSIDIRGSGPREHHRQHHATGGHQQHQPPHHHLGLGQEEQEHQHTVAHGWCPRWNDHAPPTCLFPAATGQCRELWPHGSPWYYVVSDSAGPGGEATMSRGLDRWVEGREDMASHLHLPVGHCECAARLPTDPCGTRASISGARSCLPSGLRCLGEAWQAAGWGQSLSTQSTVCRIFGIPSSGQRRVQANDLVGLSLMCYKSLCFQKLCTMSLLSLVLPVFVAPGLIDGCVDGWCFACLRGEGVQKSTKLIFWSSVLHCLHFKGHGQHFSAQVFSDCTPEPAWVIFSNCSPHPVWSAGKAGGKTKPNISKLFIAYWILHLFFYSSLQLFSSKRLLLEIFCPN